ncbi:MAG: tyrosine recombinase XerC [Bacteroides sp.]|nr:tyrosine recombinase XerC [Eubacterium sp.]MCM1417737.1 tyrosine recombinase XerC [Roseburia sp.]MCM1461372.1 tyrosine recombinase XerC [Bacteroides sp.]
MRFDDCPPYVKEFLDYMATIKMRSELTVKNYYTDLRLFLRFLKQDRGLSGDLPFDEIAIADVPEELIRSVTLTDLLAFLSFALSERGNQAKARARKAVTLRQFFKYLTTKKLWFTSSPAQELELPSPKNALPKHLTIEQATELLKSCSELKEWTDYRNFCIVTFFLNCGMRLSELTGIDVTDYTETTVGGERVTYMKILGKGSKERIVYLNAACNDAYARYLKVRPAPRDKTDKALFLSGRGKRISNRRVEQIIEEKLKQSGLSGLGFSVHKLRHTAATLMYQNGVDVRVLKEVLGHENLGTTQIYTHVANEQMKSAIDRNPLAGITADEKGKKAT